MREGATRMYRNVFMGHLSFKHCTHTLGEPGEKTGLAAYPALHRRCGATEVVGNAAGGEV